MVSLCLRWMNGLLSGGPKLVMSPWGPISIFVMGIFNRFCCSTEIRCPCALLSTLSFFTLRWIAIGSRDTRGNIIICTFCRKSYILSYASSNDDWSEIQQRERASAQEWIFPHYRNEVAYLIHTHRPCRPPTVNNASLWNVHKRQAATETQNRYVYEKNGAQV